MQFATKTDTDDQIMVAVNAKVDEWKVCAHMHATKMSTAILEFLMESSKHVGVCSTWTNEEYFIHPRTGVTAKGMGIIKSLIRGQGDTIEITEQLSILHPAMSKLACQHFNIHLVFAHSVCHSCELHTWRTSTLTVNLSFAVGLLLK